MKIPNTKQAHQQINQTSGNVEFHTPPKILKAVREVLGRIDLDPASSARANLEVGAEKFYTKEQDGLNSKWKGKVWMNHPFGFAEKACDPRFTSKPCEKKICARRGYHQFMDYPGNAGWVNKLIESYESGQVREALCICFAATSETWFQPLIRNYPVCFLYPRTNYHNSKGRLVKGVSKGSVVFYLGRNVDAFKKVFASLGAVKI